MIVRRLARLLLAAIFINGGVDTLRHPERRVALAAPFLEGAIKKLGDSLPEQVPTDPATLVRLDAMVKVGAGVGLALGRFPRLSAFVLAIDLVPTTLAGHSYWEHDDPMTRTAQRTHFMKNVGLIGGLLFAALDSGNKRAKSTSDD